MSASAILKAMGLPQGPGLCALMCGKTLQSARLFHTRLCSTAHWSTASIRHKRTQRRSSLRHTGLWTAHTGSWTLLRSTRRATRCIAMPQNPGGSIRFCAAKNSRNWYVCLHILRRD